MKKTGGCRFHCLSPTEGSFEKENSSLQHSIVASPQHSTVDPSAPLLQYSTFVSSAPISSLPAVRRGTYANADEDAYDLTQKVHQDAE